MTLKLLDLFCGAGGASKGYHRAGFDVVGIDIRPQPSYPFTFIQGDALNPPVNMKQFDVIHASPPCQRYSRMQNSRKNWEAHPDLIERVRQLLIKSCVPYIIENVPGAPLFNPLILCGSSFGLTRIRRHRLFESSLLLLGVPCRHEANSDVLSVAGHSEGGSHRNGGKRDDYWALPAKRAAMGIDWMNREELRESIPPAFTEFIGNQLAKVLVTK